MEKGQLSVPSVGFRATATRNRILPREAAVVSQNAGNLAQGQERHTHGQQKHRRGTLTASATRSSLFNQIGNLFSV